jgi:hypothetical protein
MAVYTGQNHVTPIDREVHPVAPGVKRIVCPECGGDQQRYRSLFPQELGIAECVDCKGTGFIYVDM